MIEAWLIRGLAALAALACAGAIGWGYGSSHTGKEWQGRWDARDASDAKAVRDRDSGALPKIVKEGTDYAKTTAAPVTDAPRVLVCPSATRPRNPVHAAAGAGPVPDAAAPVRAEAPVDIGAPVVTVGRDANAQVKALQDYVRDVCLK